MCPMWMTSPMIPNPTHNSTPIIVRGDGLQVCLPLPKEVGDGKFYCLRQCTSKRG